MNKLHSLIGDRSTVIAFRDLPVPHQLAIAHYMAIDGEAWEDLLGEGHDGDAELVKAALISALPNYVREYGDTQWGVVTISTEEIKQAVLTDEEIAASFSSWEPYAAWYIEKIGVPVYDALNRWPVILSSYCDETLQDGWHRLHSYIRAGHADIPAVFYPEQRDRSVHA